MAVNRVAKSVSRERKTGGENNQGTPVRAFYTMQSDDLDCSIGFNAASAKIAKRRWLPILGAWLNLNCSIGAGAGLNFALRTS